MKSNPNYPALVKEFERGNDSQSEFCKNHRLKLCNFQYHLYKERRKSKVQGKFLPVRVVEKDFATLDSRFTAEIRFNDGSMMRFSSAGCGWIGELIASLRK